FVLLPIRENAVILSLSFFLAQVIVGSKTCFIVFHTIKCLTSRCSITPALRACVGQFLSRGFMVLLRKNIP
ncbi:hypothetical protein, partial [Cellvibrio zantedeschiae]|uniref:hypothetical protein n=1 Tax=Cellvibrio zantedeschiae TaxID=1237077 RepID=UPI001E4ADE48